MSRYRSFWVYILTNRSGTLYVGVTNDLERRLAGHVASGAESSAGRYAMDRLIYAEEYPTAREAIAREEQLKGWRRAKKVALVNAQNPAWRDLRFGHALSAQD